jgi:uncharacterized protein YxjI
VKLYMKQQPFSWRDRFFIRDESDRDLLSAEGEFISLGAKLHVYDGSNRAIALIQQQLLSWRPRYRVEINGHETGSVVRRFALIGSRYDFDGPGWVAEGSFGSHAFTLYDRERVVMTVRKAWFSWGDSYELDIPVREEILPAVCVLLAIDLSLAAENNAAASMNGG